MSNLSAAIKETAAEVAAELDRLLPVPATPEKRVVEAMRYSVLAGGKCLRPMCNKKFDLSGQRVKIKERFSPFESKRIKE